MVFIKMTNQMWIVSGLEKLINETKITRINNDRYVPYQQFKSASKLTDQPIHTLVKQQHIISNIDMKKILRQSELTPQQRRTMQELKMKHELRMLNKNKNMTSEEYYFQKKKNETIKDMSSSISFGMTFIFSFFMAGLTGYYFGVYFMGLSFVHALIVAMVFIMGTIIVETSLFIIKQNRQDRLRAKGQKNNVKAYQFPKASAYPRPQKPTFKEQQKEKNKKAKAD